MAAALVERDRVPAHGIPEVVFSVTVTVELVVPSAATAVGAGGHRGLDPSAYPAVKGHGRAMSRVTVAVVSVTVRMIDLGDGVP